MTAKEKLKLRRLNRKWSNGTATMKEMMECQHLRCKRDAK